MRSTCTVREKASRELGQLGETVEDALRMARRDNISAEKARRIDQLLAPFVGRMLSSEQLRVSRAVAILEQIGGPQAQKLLEELAGGAAGARLTQEAKASLARLHSRRVQP